MPIRKTRNSRTQRDAETGEFVSKGVRKGTTNMSMKLERSQPRKKK